MGLWEDIRFAGRLLLKDKWFTAVAAIALALGIGVNATVFTFVNAVLIRGLPISDPNTAMAVTSFDRVRSRTMGVSYLDFRDWRDSTRAFSALSAYASMPANVSEEGQAPERFTGTTIAANGFQLLGIRPILGRDFVADDDHPGAQQVVLIGHGVWQNRYALDPLVIGKVIRINDVPAVIIGVMPEGFKFPQNADLWQPLMTTPNIETQKRNQRPLQVFGRLAPGTAREQAQGELITITQRLEKEHPDTNKDVQAQVQTFNENMNGGPIKTVFLSLMGAVAFVLLISCANVANLLLSRATIVRARSPCVSHLAPPAGAWCGNC